MPGAAVAANAATDTAATDAAVAAANAAGVLRTLPGRAATGTLLGGGVVLPSLCE